ncbi:hypothetical protein LP420_01920 [Massilia sp. B-10]|nr:hypothetical protein LP420_01920 [Massilia sp. B-10]
MQVQAFEQAHGVGVGAHRGPARQRAGPGRCIRVLPRCKVTRRQFDHA